MNRLIKRFGPGSKQFKTRALTLTTLALLTKAVPGVAQGKATQWIGITNPSSFDRTGEVIAIKRSLLTTGQQTLTPQVKQGKAVLISQIVDKDGDGIWDELLVEISLAPRAKDKLRIEWVADDKAASFPTVADVRLSLRSDTKTPSPDIAKATHGRGFTQNIAKPYYQLEGPGIENDKVAFRAFFDVRNGKDIYGKIVDTPVLKYVGVGASWHELQPWGMDIFRTGSSLGAGGLAVKEDKKLYRLGDADTATFTALYEGPLQAAFGLRFKGWDVGKGKGSGSETISMTKGNFYYQNDVDLSLNSLQNLIVGIADFGKGNVVYKAHNNGFSSLSTYGPQAEGTGTKLGVAVLFPSADYVEHKTTDTASAVPNTTYVALKHKGKKTVCFFAGWEKTDARFSTEAGFQTYLQEASERLAHPVQLKIINHKPSN